jgi:hypothetical protein
VSWLAETAAQQRVILTRFGFPHAVVESAERVDEEAARLREAARVVVEHFADTATARTASFDLEEVCAKLGLDPERVRERVAAHLAI